MDPSYAIPGTGGYTSNSTVGHGFPEMEVNVFDATNAVEVVIPASLLNQKIGIVKQHRDGSNGWVLNTSNSIQGYYDFSSNELLYNELELTTIDFISGIGGVNGIISVGGFSTAYADFTTYVRNYFNLDSSNTNVFTSLMDIDKNFNIQHGIFDSNALWEAISTIDASSNYNHLAGSIYLSDLTETLRYAVEFNPFGNRDPCSNLYANAIDPIFPTNYGINDGFLADDLIFIPQNGFTIQMNLNINYRNTLGAINVNLLALNPHVNKLMREVEGTELSIFNSLTTQTKSYIGRVISTPLLIRLV